MKKKIPTIIGLVLMLAGLLAGFFFIDKARLWRPKASSETTPQQIRITNIGSSSFVVSWFSTEKTIGSVSFGETTDLGNIAKDVRDRNQNNQGSFLLHYVLVENLQPETKYYFKIISGQPYSRVFDVVTASLKAPPDNDLAQGQILISEGQSAPGVIVYLSLANTTTQSSLTDGTGHWMIPLSTARTPDLKNFSTYDRGAQIEEIFVQGEKETASATLTTGNDNPTPNIYLGQTHNFLGQMPEISPEPTSIKSPTQTTPSSEKGGFDSELTITFPAEGENVNTSLPEFFGTGPENQPLTVKIESDNEITSKTKADTKGKWQWSPQSPLSPGEHKITVSYSGKDGFVRQVTRSFYVLAAGESELPSFTATPSGEKATPTSEIKVTPTLIPTATPTTQTTPTTPATPSATPPPSGISLPTVVFVGLGLATTLIGILFILF